LTDDGLVVDVFFALRWIELGNEFDQKLAIVAKLPCFADALNATRFAGLWSDAGGNDLPVQMERDF
jgi:hypothetical protein